MIEEIKKQREREMRRKEQGNRKKTTDRGEKVMKEMREKERKERKRGG